MTTIYTRKVYTKSSITLSKKDKDQISYINNTFTRTKSVHIKDVVKYISKKEVRYGHYVMYLKKKNLSWCEWKDSIWGGLVPHIRKIIL